MDPVKTSAKNTWESPKWVKDVQGFLEFANFYRRFIKDFTKLASFLTSLTRKDKEFQWTPIGEMTILKLFCNQHISPNVTVSKLCFQKINIQSVTIKLKVHSFSNHISFIEPTLMVF